MQYLVALSLLMFSFVTAANEVESFKAIEVNPQGSASHKLKASVHLQSDLRFDNALQKLMARERIAMALSNLTVNELTMDGIENAKHEVFKKLKSGGPIEGVTIQAVYVTDLVVSFVGANKASVYVRPKKNP